jgi:hypothetical protein
LNWSDSFLRITVRRCLIMLNCIDMVRAYVWKLSTSILSSVTTTGSSVKLINWACFPYLIMSFILIRDSVCIFWESSIYVGKSWSLIHILISFFLILIMDLSTHSLLRMPISINQVSQIRTRRIQKPFNRYNDSINRYMVHHIVITLHKTLAMFWPLLTIPDKSAILQKCYDDILNRYNGW